MAQRLALGQGRGGVNPRHNLFFSKTQIFWPKGNFFFHAKGTAGELQIGRLLDELDGGGLFIKRETPNGRTEKRPRAGDLSGRKSGYQPAISCASVLLPLPLSPKMATIPGLT